MLKPRVGLMVSMASPMNFLMIVVLPALSRPLPEEERGGKSGWRERRGESGLLCEQLTGLAGSEECLCVPHRTSRRISFSAVLIFLRMVSRPMMREIKRDVW